VPRVLLGRTALPALAQVGAAAPVDPHDALDAFTPDLDAAAAQLEPHPRRPIGRGELVLTADLVDQRQQFGVLAGPLRRRDPPGPPLVVGRRRDIKDP
jgi:hypothetical protein